MTEDEWLTATDLTPMLEFLRSTATDRKLRLFAVAYSRRVLHPADDERCLHAVQIAEDFADGKAVAKDLDETRTRLTEMLDEYPDAYDAVSEALYTIWYATSSDLSIPKTLVEASRHAAQSAAFAAAAASDAGEDEEQADAWVAPWIQVRGKEDGQSTNPKLDAWDAFEDDFRGRAAQEQVLWLRDIFGNPFRSVALSPAWLTPTVTSLAQAIYDERQLPSGHFDNVRMGVLADALEEAGCDNTDVLNHCRSEGPHVRGCWPIDLLLGKS